MNETRITANDVHQTLAKNMLADGMTLVLDLDKSRGTRIVDEATGTEYLDMFTFFASNALGMNHPALHDDRRFQEELLQAALNKPSNSDVYTVAMARFVDTFARVLGDPALPHLFFVEGGALAVENALKVAFDWKSRQNELAGRSPDLGTKVMHLTGAFHGRSGYTMSLTNTDPNKVARFPKFDWPRIDAPYLASGVDIEAAEAHALAQARQAFAENPHDIACFIAEPIQGEGGDRHIRPQFFAAMKQLCHDNDALFIFDEVQTGCGLTGTNWAWQGLAAASGLDVTPDVLSFGKKTQVCGVMAGGRVDEIQDNVFHVSSRINSTWGGNLTDMVRARRILEVIEADELVAAAAERGAELLALLSELAAKHPTLSDARGAGLMCAATVQSASLRDQVVVELADVEHVLLLGCGTSSLRFRPALTVTSADLQAAVAAFDRCLTRLAG